MTQTPDPLTNPGETPDPDEAPLPPLEPSVTNPDADGTDADPS